MSTSTEFTQLEYRHIALAAAAQCALLVHELAARGRVNPRQLRACVQPLLILDPGSTAELLPDVAALSEGLKAVQQTLSGDGQKEKADALRYLLGITVLQQKFNKSPALQERIRNGLRHLGSTATTPDPVDARQDADELEHFPFADIAALYQQSISTLSYRIHVAGNPQYLREKRVADQVRTLLLAGIRFSVLWQQLGGRRWHLLLHRKKIRESISLIRRSLLTVNLH